MKRTFSLLTVAFAVLSSSCATKPAAPTPEESFKSADLDGNGKVSRSEYDSHQISEMFARFDENKDSAISEKEFLDNGGTAAGFRKINASGSGSITLQEARASTGVRKSLDAPFKEADKNGNGQVSMEEFLAYRKNAFDYVR